MKRSELTSFLRERNQTANHTDFMDKYRPPYIEESGKRIYLFDHGFDINNLPIDSSIAVSQQPFGLEIPLHQHNYLELMYVFAGSCSLAIDDIPMTLSESQMVLINPGTPHTVHPTRQSDIVVNLTLKKDFLSPSFLSRLSKSGLISQFLIKALIDSRRNNRYLLLRPEDTDAIRTIMESLMCEFFDQDFVSAEIIDSYIVVLLSEWIRQTGQQSARPTAAAAPGSPVLIDFLQYIERRYRSCDLVSMADHFGFHPNYLSSLLKKGTGKTFKELLQLQRLNQAALLLSSTAMGIPEIAEEVGYSGVTFFYKKFKELFRMTPLEYRERRQAPLSPTL